MPEIIFLWLGLLCLGYFVGIARYAGWSSKFPVVWAVLGGILLMAGILILTDSIPKRIQTLCWVFGLLLLVSVLVVEGVIVSVMFLTVEPDLDYLVVLGAQVKGTRPSLSLQYRIDSACEYLKENPGQCFPGERDRMREFLRPGACMRKCSAREWTGSS